MRFPHEKLCCILTELSPQFAPLKSGLLLALGEAARLGVANSNVNEFEWTSADENIAAVSADGEVRAVGEGNVIIKGIHKDSGYFVGCAVSVVSPEKKSVIEKAKQISKGRYSQARRMSPGFYYCSSLIWRAYRDIGINFGVAKGSAPVAANEAAYLAL